MNATIYDELLNAIRSADEQGGRTHIKPIGSKREEVFAVPMATWESVRKVLEKIEADSIPA